MFYGTFIAIFSRNLWVFFFQVALFFEHFFCRYCREESQRLGKLVDLIDYFKLS